MLKGLIRKINSDARYITVFYGILVCATWQFIYDLSPHAFSFAKNSTYSLLVNYVDARYERAATLEPTNYSFFTLTILFILFSIVGIEAVVRMYQKTKENIQTHEDESPEEDKQDKEKPQKQGSRWGTILVLGIAQIYLIAIMGYGLISIAGEVIALNAITDFKQHTRIIAPYIDQQQQAQILSEWSQMHSIDDYNRVYEKIVSVAKEHNLKLVRNHMY